MAVNEGKTQGWQIVDATGQPAKGFPLLVGVFDCEEAAALALEQHLRKHDLSHATSHWHIMPANAPVADAAAQKLWEPPKQDDGTINPKDAAALKRVPMHLLPQVGVIYGAMACRDGALKYGPYNWRERAISLTQYVGAMQRHLSALLDGEDLACDSRLPHLAHVIATAAILLDAQAADALLDDRPKRSGNAAGLIAKLNARLAEESKT